MKFKLPYKKWLWLWTSANNQQKTNPKEWDKAFFGIGAYVLEGDVGNGWGSPGADPGINYEGQVGVHKCMNIITMREGRGAHKYSTM